MQIGVRQQSEITGTLDSGVHLTLIMRTCASQTSRHDLAILLNEIFQRIDIFVVNLLYVSDGEAAKLFTFKQWILLFTLFFQLAFIEFFSECHLWLLNLLSDGFEIVKMKNQIFTVAVFFGHET